MSESFGDLPELLSAVAADCGLAAARALACAFGGRRIDLPTPDRIKSEHWFSKALQGEGLTESEAASVARSLGKGRLSIPLGPFLGLAAQSRRRRANVRSLLKAKKTKAEIARECVITERSVYRIQAEEEPAELPLLKGRT